MNRGLLDRPRAVCYKVAMQFSHPRPRSGHVRSGALATMLLAYLIAAALSCSSDPDTPLGSGVDIIGSKPGTVFQDTIAVYADTVFQYGTPVASEKTLEFGRESGYTRAMIIDISFKGASADTARVVEKAELRLVADDITGSFPARFYQLRKQYAEGDSIPSLDTLAVIVDPESGSVERTLQLFPPTYPLPPALVQTWIRDSAQRTAIAILYTDDVNDRVATFKSRQSDRDKPSLQITFVGGFQRTYFAGADATFIRPTGTTDNLIVSDGLVRRVYFRVRLDELGEQSAVHTARVRFHIVPETLLGSNTKAVVYAPASPDPARKDFRSGQLVTTSSMLADDRTVDFQLTNSIFLTLQGSLPDNGFVVLFERENTELRQVELFGTDAPDSLRPRVFITSSTPAEYRR